MFFAVLKGECIKLRRAPVWIAFFLLPLIAAFMGTFNYLQNIGILKKAWYSLWTQHTIFTSFFFLPALIGILAAYQWRLEHRENNWNALMTYPVPTWMLLASKLAVTGGLAALTLLWTGLLYWLSGRLAGLTGAPPMELPRWILLGVCAGVCVSSIQLYLSMRIRSFAIPVGVALFGGIAGLLIANYGYGLYCPYSLLAMGMDANGSGGLKISETLAYLSSCAAYTTLFFLLALRTLRKRDIETS